MEVSGLFSEFYSILQGFEMENPEPTSLLTRNYFNLKKAG